MDKIDIKARAIECRAYLEACSTILEGLSAPCDAVKEVAKLLERAKDALNELDSILEGDRK